MISCEHPFYAAKLPKALASSCQLLASSSRQVPDNLMSAYGLTPSLIPFGWVGMRGSIKKKESVDGGQDGVKGGGWVRSGGRACGRGRREVGSEGAREAG